MFHHIDHLNMLKRAKALGTYLAVGVSSDELNIEKKERTPIYPLKQRLAILRALKCVDEVFVEESLEKKAEYCKSYDDIFVIGDDWRGKFDHIKTDSLDVIYLPHTPEISTTEIINKIKG